MGKELDLNCLMQDFKIEELIQIRSNIEHDIETKKEELRQMVGRRYRDVLDASNAVKRLTEISSNLINDLEYLKKTSFNLHSKIFTSNENLTTSQNIKLTTQYFLLFNTFLSQSGYTENFLSDVFCFLLADGFYRKFLAKSACLSDEKNLKNLSFVLQEIFDCLIAIKLDLADQIIKELGNETDVEKVILNLTAIALLNNLSIEALLDLYLNAKQDVIFLSLKSSTTSLIKVLKIIRNTLQIIEKIFGLNENFLNSLRLITTEGWCPDSIKTIIGDQLSENKKIIEIEILNVNKLYSSNFIVPFSFQNVQEKILNWLKQLCKVSSDLVQTMCGHFEKTDQIVEFVVATNQIFTNVITEWSSVISSLLIYQNLFGDLILEKFQTLIKNELNILEKDFIENFLKCNTNPLPLFQKRAVKFDSLLASGISYDLYHLTKNLFDEIQKIFSNVKKYITFGCEKNVEILQDTLSNSILTFVVKLLDYFKIPKENIDEYNKSSSKYVLSLQTSLLTNKKENLEEQKKWLGTFRLFLALIQHEPSVFCLCMNKNVKNITKCNKYLTFAAEIALCNFMEFVIEDCVEKSYLKLMPETSASETLWLNLIQEFEKVEFEETNKINVPTQLSNYYFQFLYNVSHQIHDNSLAHLFTQNVINFISAKLGHILMLNLKECAEKCSNASAICTQLLFDCKVLFLMFLKQEMVEIGEKIIAKMEPFEVKLIDEPLNQNVKLFVQRTSMIFGLLQLESVALLSKSQNQQHNNDLSSSYLALVDITPKISNIRRLPLIPRLSKLKNDTESTFKKDVTKNTEKNIDLSNTANIYGILNNGNSIGKAPSGTSLTTFYDKISTGWFKN